MLHQTTPEIFGEGKLKNMDNLSQLEEDYKIYRRKNETTKGEQVLYY